MNNSDSEKIAEAKKKLRSEAVRNRIEKTAADNTSINDSLIADNVIKFISENYEIDKVCVSAYIPMKSEVSLLKLMRKLDSSGVCVCVPAVADKEEPMLFNEWHETSETKKGVYGAEEIKGERTAVPDILLVPLLAFDRKGFRLGYGGGCYDRTIAFLKKNKNITTIGMAYSFQETKEVPHGELDVQMDWFITEKEIIKTDKI